MTDKLCISGEHILVIRWRDLQVGIASHGDRYKVMWMSDVSWGRAIEDVVRSHSCSSRQSCGRGKTDVIIPVFTREGTKIGYLLKVTMLVDDRTMTSMSSAF